MAVYHQVYDWTCRTGISSGTLYTRQSSMGFLFTVHACRVQVKEIKLRQQNWMKQRTQSLVTAGDRRNCAGL